MIAAAAAAALSLLAGPSAAAQPVPTVDMFGPHAGFAKAILERMPISVGLAPEFWSDDPMSVQNRYEWLQPVLDTWNTAAGWDVFVQVGASVQVIDGEAVMVESGAPADVVFHTVQNDHPRCGDNAGACAWIDEFPAGQYRFELCHVEFWPWYPTADVVAHELGHCLGFVDVPVDQQIPGGYAGIMTHDRPWGMTPDNEYDRASLVEAGYRTEQ